MPHGLWREGGHHDGESGAGGSRRARRDHDAGGTRMKRLRIGVSSCLLGDEVRFDGGHKRDVSLLEAFDPYVEWVRVCPEVELGLGVPREPVRLVSAPGGPRMIAVQSGIDHTGPMQEYAQRRVHELARASLSGYILKAKSPSCGLHGVSVHDDTGTAIATGLGLF